MKGIVDRIEGNYVILEINGEIQSIKKEKFPEEIKEGDIVKFKENKFIILKEETEKRRKSIEELFNDLKE
ncbi:DUF3006 domain-containing protein [Anaerosalibacter massiliensis]|uniref:DUF3006 domain-containing protein n=1 Tax=Anaerosalibacter massiliensis TaxID=1347392 RepID=A0A9X2S3B4_9FIRM|nr:DUF3006 domain-containing protein [Anaerosalibacter massiliensis]MCR2042510.1 DUF3006 domain-containing protein [Anaerosalibacter massiliensis]